MIGLRLPKNFGKFFDFFDFSPKPKFSHENRNRLEIANTEVYNLAGSKIGGADQKLGCLDKMKFLAIFKQFFGQNSI